MRSEQREQEPPLTMACRQYLALRGQQQITTGEVLAIAEGLCYGYEQAHACAWLRGLAAGEAPR